ncbi:MAG: hypothetical protein U5L11_12960 [Arhodomonas sp.]|nr:hypothetical protein [Arhodomonas sp.]
MLLQLPRRAGGRCRSAWTPSCAAAPGDWDWAVEVRDSALACRRRLRRVA